MIDLEKYRRAVFSQVVRHRERYPNEDYHTAINRLVSGTSCPVIVLAHFIGEIEGYTDELNGIIQGFKDFYGERD